MNDPELKAIGEIANALADLTDEQRRNVLLYVNARYSSQLPPLRGRTATSTDSDRPALGAGQYADLGDLFDAANPQTEAERVLVVAYWVQVVEGTEGFESFRVNKELKHLGHHVSNITRAIDSMIGQTPRLILQTSKSGSARQARKRYKVTREGIKRVQAMLAQSNGDDNGG
jgi:hypothetical protein